MTAAVARVRHHPRIEQRVGEHQRPGRERRNRGCPGDQIEFVTPGGIV